MVSKLGKSEDELYKSRDWLYQRIAVEGKTYKELGRELGVTNVTIGNWARRYDITKPSFQETFTPTYEEVLAKWSFSKNNELNILQEEVSPYSETEAWWICENGHEFKCTPSKIMKRKNFCLECANMSHYGKISILEKAPHLEKEWDYEENDKQGWKINEITYGSETRINWKCLECSHKWSMLAMPRINGGGCPACSNKTVTERNCLFVVRPDLAIQWDYDKNTLTPMEIVPNSNDRVFWICNHCQYKWGSLMYSRAYSKDNKCPNCNGFILNESNNFEAVYPDKAEEWDYEMNYPLTPKDVFASVKDMYWWICPQGHSYDMSTNKRSRGQGCRHCSKWRRTSMGEQTVYFYIKRLFPDAVNGYTFNYSGLFIEYDIYVPSLKIAIEYDGYYYHKEEGRKIIDARKNMVAIVNDEAMFRVREEGLEDILFSTNILNLNTRLTDIDEKIVKLISSIKAVFKDQLEEEVLDKFSLLKVDSKTDRYEIQQHIKMCDFEKSLQFTHPEVANYWHPIKNLTFKPEHLTFGSNLIVWWECEKDHEWEQAVCEVVNNKNKCQECKREDKTKK